VLQELGSTGLYGIDEWDVLWTTRVILFTESIMVGEGSQHKAKLRGRELNLSASRSPVEEPETLKFSILCFHHVRIVM